MAMASRSFDQPSGATRIHTRAKNKKSRLGCAECKQKRLKCDETHPQCKQCTKRGRQCPGYSKQYRWSRVHEKAQASDNTNDFWPRSEHNALLGALPQPQCCDGSHAAESEHAHPQSTQQSQPEESPMLPLPTPGLDGDFCAAVSPLAGAAGIDQQEGSNSEDTLEVPQIAHGTGLTPWLCGSDLGWLDDPPITQTDDVFSEDIFSSLCGRSPVTAGDQPEPNPSKPSDTSLVIARPKPPKLLYTPIDLSTMLMEYWFSDVCPMWSAFDSPENPHRQLASSAWQQSEAVYYALQSMSAACLMDSLPHVKKYIGELSSQAVQAIQAGVVAHKQLCKASRFPKELLLAIIAMGTSVCWSDTRQLGLWFLAKAHELLEQYENDAIQLDEPGRQELEYFREALVYWEMLYRVVGSDPRSHLRRRKKEYMRRIVHAMSLDDESPPSRTEAIRPGEYADAETRPSKNLAVHPWTGISTDIQHTFGLVILLCRDHRLAARKPEKRTTAALSDALCEIRMARDLARELISTDVYAGDHSTSPATWFKGTGDSTTPIGHLIDTAEAYRLAALLSLYQTFPDLETADLDQEIGEGVQETSNDSGHMQACLALSLRLIDTLRRVPAESGTRCIHPILIISAGSGMRFTSTPGESPLPSRDGGDAYDSPLQPRSQGCLNSQSASVDVDLLSAAHRPAVRDFKSASVTHATLQVSRGRRFVIDRLCALQRSLPPRPIGVALDLVKAVWMEYDYGGGRDIHWIDVMVDKGHQTLFG